MNTVHVNRKAASRVDAGHPWIFRSDIPTIDGVTPGEVVRVVSGQRTLGIAHFSAASQITLRMLSPRVEEPDKAFFAEKFKRAAAFRAEVVHNTDAYRLIYAEADGLPGLIVDRYANYFVVQALNQGMDRSLPLIIAALEEMYWPAGILARNDAAVRSHEALPRESHIISGEIPDAIDIVMNGLQLRADLQRGMKTGIFLDQRENYVAAAAHARGRALDAFTSTGGFALHHASKCDTVEAIDSSEPALAAARANAAANQIANIEFREADVFDALTGFVGARREFETIVLDPPAFAKARGHVDAAMRAYKEINRRALNMLTPGGVLVSCSCSHHVTEADLLGVIADAANENKRTLRVLQRRTQAADHPVLLTVPETLYLKCLILQVVE